MALNNIQERVERSLFEAIRKLLVQQGYLPDITDPAYANTQVGQDAWAAAEDAVVNAKGFAAEVFNHSSSLSKGLKRVPRIAIIPRRIMPGDIGRSVNPRYKINPLNPDNIIDASPAYQSSNLHIDINLVSGNAAQDRFLHSIMAGALGVWGFIPLADDPNAQPFFIRQFNFYDLPDNKNGIEEKVYSYEIPDLYLFDTDAPFAISPIKNITLKTTNLELQTIAARDGTIIGPYQQEDNLYIDLSGIYPNQP